MDEQQEIRNRIKSRRISGGSNYVHHPLLFSLFLGFFLFGLYYFDIISLDKISQLISSYSKKIVQMYEMKNEDEIVSVSNKLDMYTYLEDNKFLCESNYVPSLENGLVVYVGTKNGIGQIVVNYDSDICVVYNHIDSIQVNVYDRVEKGIMLGTYEEYFEMDFKKNNEPISYDDFLSIY